MAGFKVLTHHDLNVLADHFARDLVTRPTDADLLSPEYVIVQTPGMRRWLALETARRNTIFTQAKVLMPKQFVMLLGSWLTGTEEKRSPFDRDVLPWALYRHITLGLRAGVRELEQLKRFAGTEDQGRDLFSLAERTADILDQYMLYRPDWLDLWDTGKRKFPDQEAEVWQKYIWNGLVAENNALGITSPARYIRTLLERMSRGADENRRRLPRRVLLFGMSILPPSYLEVFSALGNVIDVVLYLQVPSIHYFGDLQSDRQIQRRRRIQKSVTDSIQGPTSTENRLLRNLGQMGKEFMDLLLGAQADLNELYDFDQLMQDNDRGSTLLARVQRDVVLCAEASREPIAEDPDDWSIRLAPCHGPLREVEVLHDLLLDSFAAHADLSPSDVVVVTPDIETYGPLVELVFGDAEQRTGVSIPYSIADRSVLTENKVARFVQDTLDAVTGRFEASAILSLFGSASELSGMPLSLNDQDLLRRWCRNSGIRWGYDRSFRSDLELPATEEYTWRYGIDRLIAGYAMDDENRLPDGLYPAVEVEGDGAELLGRLADLVDSLSELARFSTEDRTIDEWNEVLARLTRRILSRREQPEGDEESATDAVSRALSSLRERIMVSGTGSEKFSFGIYAQSVVEELSQADGGRGFAGGAVTVAGMIPLRSIPFRVVAMLGMNRATFPRHSIRPQFDLMGRAPGRPGDRDSLKSDRYVFLETLLSARERLIITWTGFDIRDGSVIPPSVLVDEFKAHLDRDYRLGDDARGVLPAGEGSLVKYPLHPFSSRYRSLDPRDARLQTWNQSWFRSPEEQPERTGMFQWKAADQRIEDDGVIDGNVIIDVLSDPMKAFLVQGCRIQRPGKDELTSDAELFALDNLDQWRLRNAILREHLGIDGDAVGKLIAQGYVPPGTPGSSRIQQEHHTVGQRFTGSILGNAPHEFKRYRVRKEAQNQLYRLDVEIISVRGDTAIVPDVGKADARRRLKLWLCHLFLNLDGPVRTTLVALDETVNLHPLRQSDATTTLGSLQALAIEGRRRLLPFIPDVSLALVQGKDSPDDARREAWKGLRETITLTQRREYRYDSDWANAFQQAESWSDAMNMVPGGEKAFEEMAELIFLPFLKCAGGPE